MSLSHLLLHVVTVGDEGREFASLVQTGPKQSGDLLDNRLRCQESCILLGCTMHMQRISRSDMHPMSMIASHMVIH